MQSTFKVIIDTEQGRVVHPAADLSEAISIYRQKLDEYPQSQIHLVRDMPSAAPEPDGSPVGTATPPSPKVEKHKQIDSRYLTQQTDGADPSNPLYGKVAVLSGTFEQIHMERDEVAAAIQRLGAKLNRSVSATMQVFVAGDKVGPAKFKQVEALRAEGRDIRIISQLEFKEICNKHLKQ